MGGHLPPSSRTTPRIIIFWRLLVLKVHFSFLAFSTLGPLGFLKVPWMASLSWRLLDRRSMTKYILSEKIKVSTWRPLLSLEIADWALTLHLLVMVVSSKGTLRWATDSKPLTKAKPLLPWKSHSPRSPKSQASEQSHGNCAVDKSGRCNGASVSYQVSALDLNNASSRILFEPKSVALLIPTSSRAPSNSLWVAGTRLCGHSGCSCSTWGVYVGGWRCMSGCVCVWGGGGGVCQSVCLLRTSRKTAVGRRKRTDVPNQSKPNHAHSTVQKPER